MSGIDVKFKNISYKFKIKINSQNKKYGGTICLKYNYCRE